jgi:hypothetical protein
MRCRPNRFDQRLRGVDTNEHEHEQEQHHHGAGVDNDLDDAQEQRVLCDVEDGEHDHRGGQEHRGVHRFGRGDHADCADNRDGAQDPEQHRLCCGGVTGDVRGRLREKLQCHVTSSVTGLMLPR